MRGFISGGLQGAQTSLSRQLARKYQVEQDTENTRRWDLNYGLQKATVDSNLATAAQNRDFMSQLQPHQVTAAELANEGTRQTIDHRAAEHPHRVTGLQLANALSGQTYQQRADTHPLNLRQQGLTNTRMADDNQFMREYRPGLMEAQRIGNERNQQIINQSHELFPRQITAADLANMQSYDANKRANDLHPYTIAQASVGNRLTEAQLNRINMMLPWEIQQLQANINYVNAQGQALSAPESGIDSLPTFLSNVETWGNAFMDRLPGFREKGWFIFDKEQNPFGVFQSMEGYGKQIGATLQGSNPTQFELNRIATTALIGIEKHKGFKEFAERMVGKNPMAQDLFSRQIRQGIMMGMMRGMGYDIPGGTHPSMHEQAQGALDSRGTPINAGNIGKAALGISAVATPLGFIPGPVGKTARALNPARWVYKGGKRLYQGLPNTPDMVKKIATTQKLNMARSKVMRLQNDIAKYGATPKRVQSYQDAMDALRKLEPPANQPPISPHNLYQGAVGRTDTFP